MWVVFDLMGTLIWRDWTTTDEEIDIQVLKEFGYYSEDLERNYQKVVKKVLKKMLEAPVEVRIRKPHLFWIYLVEELELDIDEETIYKMNERFNEILITHLFVNKRLLELAKALKRAGVTTIILTNSYRYLVDKILKRFPEVKEAFDYVFCADDTRMKKAEGAIDFVIERLGLNPEEGIIIGDDEEQDGSHPQLLFLKVDQCWERYIKC